MIRVGPSARTSAIYGTRGLYGEILASADDLAGQLSALTHRPEAEEWVAAVRALLWWRAVEVEALPAPVAVAVTP